METIQLVLIFNIVLFTIFLIVLMFIPSYKFRGKTLNKRKKLYNQKVAELITRNSQYGSMTFPKGIGKMEFFNNIPNQSKLKK